MADRIRVSHLDNSQLHAPVGAANRLLTAIPARVKLKITAANSSNQPLGRMAKNTDEMATVVVGDKCDE